MYVLGIRLHINEVADVISEHVQYVVKNPLFAILKILQKRFETVIVLRFIVYNKSMITTGFWTKLNEFGHQRYVIYLQDHARFKILHKRFESMIALHEPT